MLSAITIGNIKFAVFEYCGFRWHKSFHFFIGWNFVGRINCKQNFSVDCGFINLVFYSIGNKQKIFLACILNCKSVRPGKFCSPGFNKFPTFIVNDNVVFGFVCQQKYPAFYILNHFVAIIYRGLPRIEHSPFFVHTVGHLIVTINRIIFHAKQVFCNK